MATQRFTLSRRPGSTEYVLNAEQEAEFRRLYPTTPSHRLCLIFGISRTTQLRLANALGIEKDMCSMIRERLRKERQRLQLGMKQHTMMHIPLYKYTASQIFHRTKASRYGYIPGDYHEDSGERYTIYYDSNTRRSPRFEQGLRDCGFTVKEKKNN